MARLSDSFDVFDDPTEPRSGASTGPGPGAETPAEPLAAKPSATRQARPARPRAVSEAPAQMDKYEKARWRTSLQNGARKLARDREQLDESEQAWAALVARARAEQVPANVILAAAADADVELPE